MPQYTHSFPSGPGNGQIFPPVPGTGSVQFLFDEDMGCWRRVPETPVPEKIDAGTIRSGTIDRNRLPSTGVLSGTYAGIASISVNEKGQVTSIVEST